jgi:cytochrome c
LRRRAALVLAALAAGCGARAAGDPGRGEQVFQYCFACHSVEPGETRLQGPNLRGIVGRRIAAEVGFAYSPAMRAFAEREKDWSETLLDRYLADPLRVVPRTSMAFPGVEDDDERADVIAYLRATGAGRP